jgi:hypothetical protein
MKEKISKGKETKKKPKSDVLPDFFTLPAGTKIVTEDGTIIDLPQSTLVWPKKP